MSVEDSEDEVIDDEEYLAAKCELQELGFQYRLIRCRRHAPSPKETTVSQDWCMECQTRLFYLSHEGKQIVRTLIHGDNQKDFVPKGAKFKSVSPLCQQMVQRRLAHRYNLCSISFTNDMLPPINALATPFYFKDPSSPLLIIIPGKGDTRAGIMSTKQIVLSGMEEGSAEFFLQQAYQYHNMAVLLLDPNARGTQSGMTCIEQSLTAVFGQRVADNVDSSRRKIFILAHSAAGGYLVRYLLLGECRLALRRNLCAICFTDSTHNIQWASKEEYDPQKETSLFQFLQSDRCLYIRNTSTHHMDTFANSKDRKLGETIPFDVHWQRRFGKIPTVWAGTTVHSLICWNARNVVWDFFVGISKTVKNAEKEGASDGAT